jgi:hypothetical protein
MPGSPSIRSRFRRIGAIRAIASLRVTVVCLALLFVLTAWGTLYQVDHGLYAAQQRFFVSWFLLAGGYVPVPGGKLVMWVLFLNVTCTATIRFAWRRERIGIWLTHVGLVVMLVGAFLTHRYAKESHLPLEEGQLANVAIDWHDWELAVWPIADGDSRSVTAFDTTLLRDGATLSVPGAGLDLVVVNYYANAMVTPAAADAAPTLTPLARADDPKQNVPGAALRVAGTHEALLWGGMPALHPARPRAEPVEITVGDQRVAMVLRRRRHPLPFAVQLQDFSKAEHPGTGIASAYESDVSLHYDGINRDVRIYMNHPLRLRNFTLYQASYSVTQDGRETSVFAVVENRGRLLPYISCGIVFAGLLIHFVVMLLKAFSRRRDQAATG